MLQHSIETARLRGVIAAETGADIQIAKMGGLLHDIGKAVDHEVEGPHAADRRADRAAPQPADAGDQRHRRAPPGSRVRLRRGAHRPDRRRHQRVAGRVLAASRAETYIKRLEELQAIADSFEGVEKSFAVQAGREVRILVRPEEIDDLASTRLARDIVRKIEESLTYPGQIKVTVIRETRAVEYAK